MYNEDETGILQDMEEQYEMAKFSTNQQKEIREHIQGITSILDGSLTRQEVEDPDCYYLACVDCPARLKNSSCFWIVSQLPEIHAQTGIGGGLVEFPSISLEELRQDLFYQDLFKPTNSTGGKQNDR